MKTRFACLGLIATLGISAITLNTMSRAIEEISSGGTTTRVSVSSAGVESNGPSWWPALSGDGRYVAFQSEASNLVEDDSNNVYDIFLHDRQTGQTSRITVNAEGVEANGPSYLEDISADGRFITYGSVADNLVSGDTNGTNDVLVHDRMTGTTTLGSVASDGTQGNNPSMGSVISEDGRYVAFSSSASNLVPSDTNGYLDDIFFHDRISGETTLISKSSDGVQGNDHSSAPSMSADGRLIVFSSSAGNLVGDDTNGHADVFLHDRQTGETSRLSRAYNGEEADGSSASPIISPDGGLVLINSDATNLVPDDTNGWQDVFLIDLVSGSITRVSVNSEGIEGDGYSFGRSLSADGRFVAFQSDARNLVNGDSNNDADIFVRDTQTGQTFLVSVSSGGEQAESYAGDAYISLDGQVIAFVSSAENLVGEDTNYAFDVFVHEPEYPEPTPTPTPTDIPPVSWETLLPLTLRQLLSNFPGP